jgi:hypothetical protein
LRCTKYNNGITIVANHVSIGDIFCMSANFAAAFVAKEGVRKVPFIGYIAETIGTIFVKRESIECSTDGSNDDRSRSTRSSNNSSNSSSSNTSNNNSTPPTTSSKSSNGNDKTADDGGNNNVRQKRATNAVMDRQLKFKYRKRF